MYEAIPETDLAYTAGIIDGEGNIGIYRNTNKYNQTVYRLRVRVTNTDEWLVYWLQSCYGGYVGCQKRRPGKNWKPAWYWVISDTGALCFLETVVKYIRMKKAQADIAIRFQQTKTGRTGRRPTDERLALEEAEKILIQGLNKRGL